MRFVAVRRYWIAVALTLVCLFSWRVGDEHIMSVASGLRLQWKASENIALGQRVSFRPVPNYTLTSVGDSDADDLTDGRVSTYRGAKIWYDASSVGFWGVPYVEVTVPLRNWSSVTSVGIRLLGGTDQPGLSFPLHVILLARGKDGRLREIDRYDSSKPEDRIRFEIPSEQGKAWVHTLTFAGLSFDSDEIVLGIRGSRLIATDELFVEGSALPTDDVVKRSNGDTQPSSSAQFHKARLVVSDISGPTPVATIESEDSLLVELILPHGLQIDRAVGGDRFSVHELAIKTIQSEGVVTHSFRVQSCSGPTCFWLYLRADSSMADDAVVAMRTRTNTMDSRWNYTPVRYVSTKPVLTESELMFSLGWYPLQNLSMWPNTLESLQRFGINTISVFGEPWPERRDASALGLLSEARASGFKVLLLTSPFERMRRDGKTKPEVFCQVDGSTELCPSYRGVEFEKMLYRYVQDVTEFSPDYVVTDVENWSHRGPTDFSECTRCLSSLSQSSLGSRESWLRAQGQDMYVRFKLGDVVELSSYDFRPGEGYQKTWFFDDLFPEIVQFANPSHYSAFDSYSLGKLADLVQRDSRLSNTRVIPWISAGYAGAVAMEQAEVALWEILINGGVGALWFSHQYFDTETLLAMNHVRAELAGFERTVLDGSRLQLYCGDMRATARSRNGRIVGIIVNDGDEPGTCHIQLPIETDSIVRYESAERTIRSASPGILLDIPQGGSIRFLVHPISEIL